MQCHEFETRVNDLLDQRQSPEGDAALEQHAKQCGECRELLAALTSAVGELERLTIPAASADLAERVAAELKAAPALQVPVLQVTARRPSWKLWRLAAAAVTAAAVWLLLGAPGLRQPLAPIVLPENHVAQDVDVPVVEATAIAGDKLRELQEQTRESLALALLVVPGLGGSASDTAPQAAPQPAWGQEVSDTLAPVTRSTTGALETLWQTLAPSGEDKTT